MRELICVSFLLIFSAIASAEGEIDAQKLVGQWVPAQVPGKLASKFTKTFTKDGKFAQGDSASGGLKLEGTYKLEGAKLTTKFNDVPGVPGETLTYTIKKVSDKELVLSQGKMSETYKRVK